MSTTRMRKCCPKCDSVNVQRRMRIKPRYKCTQCFWEGDIVSTKEVKTPKSYRRACFEKVLPQVD